jgi:UDP-N-acetylmuramate dehydrogenase
VTTPKRDVPLAQYTSLKLGGPARYLLKATTRAEVAEALAWAKEAGERAAILGGGSNLVIPDAGFPGLVLRIATRGIKLVDDGAHMVLQAEAGEPWQNVVDAALAANLAGLECLTGIPGLAGATPIQNVGAYGQEVSDTLLDVDVLDRSNGRELTLENHACSFGYRQSRFKREPDRFVVLGVRFRLERFGPPTVRYVELSRVLAGVARPTLQDVAQRVRALRASKSMLLDPKDPNSRNVGSFFKNPILTEERAARLRAQCLAEGLVREEREVPCFAAPSVGSLASSGMAGVKVAAGFLIESAGIKRGMRRGPVGISTAHALCLVHHAGGTTQALLDLADEVRSAVRTRFGIELEMEPVLW